MNADDPIPFRLAESLPADEARALVEQAERAFDVMLDEHTANRPNSARARLCILEARQCRELAGVFAQLAIADELAEIRRLLASRVVGL